MKKMNFGPGETRLLLAMLVVVGHFSRFNLGTAAVYMFFFLSGYWIQQVYPTKYAQTRNPFLTFIISRIWRILPIFLVCSAAALLVEYSRSRADGQPTVTASMLLPSTIILGYSSLEFRPLWTAWSLDIELQYYLIAPMLSHIITRGSATASFVFALVVAPISAFYLGGVWVFSYLPFFLAGMLASLHAAKVESRTARTVAVTLVAALIALAMCPPGFQILLGSAQMPEYAKYNPLLQVIVAGYCLPLLLWSVHRKNGSLDHMFGDLSYIVYLVHSVALSLVLRMFPWFPSATLWLRLIFTLAIFVAVAACSYGLWLAVDRPSNRLRSVFVNSRKVRACQAFVTAHVREPNG